MLTLEQLQGQELFIDSMKLQRVDHQLTFSLDVRFKNSRCNLVFHNVSSFCVNHLSYPLQISGFEIDDNLCNGWQSDVRYKVHDFENGSICFYCEKIEVSI